MVEYKTVYDYCLSRDIDCTQSERSIHNYNLLEISTENDAVIKKDKFNKNIFPLEILDSYFAA